MNSKFLFVLRNGHDPATAEKKTMHTSIDDFRCMLSIFSTSNTSWAFPSFLRNQDFAWICKNVRQKASLRSYVSRFSKWEMDITLRARIAGGWLKYYFVSYYFCSHEVGDLYTLRRKLRQHGVSSPRDSQHFQYCRILLLGIQCMFCLLSDPSSIVQLIRSFNPSLTSWTQNRFVSTFGHQNSNDILPFPREEYLTWVLSRHTHIIIQYSHDIDMS